MIKLLRIVFISLILLGLFSKMTAPSILDDKVNDDIKKKALNYLELERYNNELRLWILMLGYDESRNNWLEVNQIGAFSEYQFLNSTLKSLGYGHITLSKFKKDPNIFPPELQKQVLLDLMEANSITLKSYIKDFENLEIRGIKINKAGLLAAAHLGGPGNVILYLNSNGNINKKDIFGTSIETYLKRYNIFDLTLNLI